VSSQHTLNHLDCPACALHSGPQSMLTPETPFSVAAQIWLQDHSPYIKPGTLRVYKQYAKALTDFFQDMPLGKFHIGHVRAYQRWRLETACPTVVNAEIQSVLKQMLTEVMIWPNIKGLYRTVPVVKKKVRKSMSEAEERRFLAVALDPQKPRRLLAGHCLVVMQNTSAGFGELRHLKREDLLLHEEPPFIAINEGTKNDFRIRTVPLNHVALRSIRWLLHRWEELGGTENGQYLLPHHAVRTEEERKGRGHKRTHPPDFTAPMGSIYRAARAIFKEAGLSEFVPYDMRSCAITKVLADPDCSDQMAEELIGHSDTITTLRYSRQRLEKKAVVMDKMCIEKQSAPKLFVIASRK
jgi:integrase